MSASALPTYIPLEDKLPWFEAVCVVMPQLPYVREECLRPQYKNLTNLTAGFCYTASEAIYHLSEDRMKPWCVRYGPLAHQTHWYLTVAETGKIVDVTASQFSDLDVYAMYEFGVGKGFLTKGPSKRARAVLDRISRRHYFQKNARHYTFQHAQERFATVKVRPHRA